MTVKHHLVNVGIPGLTSSALSIATRALIRQLEQLGPIRFSCRVCSKSAGTCGPRLCAEMADQFSAGVEGGLDQACTATQVIADSGSSSS